ncbi:MAG TPA: site-2 protease family protein [Acidimicrobiales bacterium]|nr:site-2 protease family protein [Acidimicrobiales bacterium]
MEPTFRLLRVRGIPVDAHWTWPVAFAIVAWTLARSVLPAAYPGVGHGAHLAMAVVVAGLLFASVVLHELAHAVVARREGMPVEGITLWLLGGVSDVGARADSPGQELRVAASGPVVSLLLAGLFLAASAGGRRLGGPEAVDGVAEYVGRLNVLVAAFNLIPALPLDGGRILRAWLWRRQRSLLAATRSGARAGQAFGLTLLVVGVLNLVSGTGLVGVWLAVLGGYLVCQASSELATARTRDQLGDLTAGDVMASDPGVVLRDTPIARLVESPPAPERSGYPVLGGGRLLGVVALASARSVPSAERDRRRVEDVMTPLDDVPMVDAGVPVLDVLDRLTAANPIGQVVVVADGCVVGILDEDDVALALDRSSNGHSTNGHVMTGASADGQPSAGQAFAGQAFAGQAADGQEADLQVVDGRVVDGRVVDGRVADNSPGADQSEDSRSGEGRGPGVRAWVLVAAVCLVTAAGLYRPPVAIVTPGRTVDVGAGVTVGGVPMTPVSGRYLSTSVEMRRTTGLGALIAALRDGHRLVPLAELEERATAEDAAARHPGLDRETRILAAVAAARSQNLPATVAGTGVRIVAVRPGSPADGVLRPDDVILAAEGRPVTLAATLTELVQRKPPRTRMQLWVDRGGRVREVSVTTGKAPGPAGGGDLGLVVETRDLAVDLPFEVRFPGGAAATGPGAGLAYALAIADLLSSHDLAGGRTIVAVGTLDADGRVGPVGSAPALGEAAARAQASAFVVPPEEVDAARRDGLQVEGVESLARALEALSTSV